MMSKEHLNGPSFHATTISGLTSGSFLRDNDIAEWLPAARPSEDADRKAPLHQALVRHGQDGALQVAGHHFPIGCVALEITQRCNLDCTACYLSDLSEAVKDLPLPEILRRIDEIAHHYGPRTNVQITGGDPTLRSIDDLEKIVRHISSHNMRAALFTNGIKATRSMLMRLAKVGLNDVAFHVDITQERKGYASEADLNVIRDEYIARARGTGLQVLFNTTIYEGNIGDVAMLAKFFRDRARDVHLASFQMIADTGRGVDRDRSNAITQDSVIEKISQGAGIDLSFDMPRVGHSDCNRYAGILTAGDRTAAIFTPKDRPFLEAVFQAGRNWFSDRHDLRGTITNTASSLFHDPGLGLRSIDFGLRKLWRLRGGLLASRGRINRLTFYIHNFMHADHLERERCESCVFMTMTRDGPISMCVHNAKRDTFLTQAVKLGDEEWSPLPDGLHRDIIDIGALPLKRLKGRARAEKMSMRAHQNLQTRDHPIRDKVS